MHYNSEGHIFHPGVIRICYYTSNILYLLYIKFVSSRKQGVCRQRRQFTLVNKLHCIIFLPSVSPQISCLLHNIGNYTSPAAPALKKKSKLLISQLKTTHHFNWISTVNGILVHIWFEVCENWGILIHLASPFGNFIICSLPLLPLISTIRIIHFKCLAYVQVCTIVVLEMKIKHLDLK
jgi:hypothetical protein